MGKTEIMRDRYKKWQFCSVACYDTAGAGQVRVRVQDAADLTRTEFFPIKRSMGSRVKVE